MAHKMPSSVVCRICGGKFMKHSYPIHVVRCQKNWDASHNKCDRCGRDISNDDWSLHRADCKVDPEYQKRVKAAAAAQKRAEKAAKDAAERKASQEKLRAEMMAAGQEPVADGVCMECTQQSAVWHCKECEMDMCGECDARIHSRGARVRHERAEIASFTENKQDEMAVVEDQVDREECKTCGRKFAKDRVYIHERICKKISSKKPKKPKYGSQIRSKGTEYEKFVKRRPPTPPEIKQWREEGGRRWKKELDGFRGLIEANRLTQSGNFDGAFEEKKSGPPPPRRPDSARASSASKSVNKSAAALKKAQQSKYEAPQSSAADSTEIKRDMLLKATPDPQQLKQQLDDFQTVIPPKARERNTEARERLRAAQDAEAAAEAAAAAAAAETSARRSTAGSSNKGGSASVSRTAASATATSMQRSSSIASASSSATAETASQRRRSGDSSSGRTAGGNTSVRSAPKSKPTSAGSSRSARSQSIGRVGQRTQQVSGPLFTKGNDMGGSHVTKSGGVRSQYTDRRVARERAEVAMKAMKAEKRASAGSSRRSASLGRSQAARGALPRSGSTSSSRGSANLAASRRAGSGKLSGATQQGSGSSSSIVSQRSSGTPPLMGAAKLRAATRAPTPERRVATPEYNAPASATATSSAASTGAAPLPPSSSLSMQDYMARERLRRQQSRGGRSFDAVRSDVTGNTTGPVVHGGASQRSQSKAVQPQRSRPERVEPPVSTTTPTPTPAPAPAPALGATAASVSVQESESNSRPMPPATAAKGVAIEVPVGKGKKAMPLLSNPRDRAKGTSKEPRPGPVGTDMILSGPKGRTPVTRMMQAKMVDGKVQRVLVADPQKLAANKRNQPAAAAAAPASNSREDVRAARAAYYDRLLSKNE